MQDEDTALDNFDIINIDQEKKSNHKKIYHNVSSLHNITTVTVVVESEGKKLLLGRTSYYYESQ